MDDTVMYLKKQIARRVHKAATDKAKELFGDIVDCVWITTWDLSIDQVSVKERLDDVLIDLKKGLRYDGEDIWIRFTNGKVVEFSNSEWATMENPDFEASYEA